MRKLLLGTSALIGATALVASASAAAPELTISGNLNFEWVGGENQATAPADNTPDLDNGGSGEDRGAGGSGWHFEQANSVSEIKFFAEGESDGGLTYGADIQYRYLNDTTATGSAVDEAYIFVSGDWGTVHLGQDDGAVNQTRFYAGSIAPGGYLIDGWSTSLAPKSIRSYSDANKILYVSPDWSGFKFAASVEEAQGANAAGQIFDDQYELGASYTADFGDGSFGVSLAHQSADFVGLVGDMNRAARNAHTNDDNDETIFGFKATFGDFSIAGSYADAGESGLTRVQQANTGEAWETTTLGVAYDLGGGMAVGISYAERERTLATNLAPMAAATVDVTTAGAAFRSEVTQELIVIDFGFPIMEGMVGYAGIAFSDYSQTTHNLTQAAPGMPVVVQAGRGAVGTANNIADVDSRANNDATTYVIGTTVSF